MNYNFNYYIEQAACGLNSRTEANIYNKEGNLPIITAPMYSVLDDSEKGQIFYNKLHENKVQICQPRHVNFNEGGKDGNHYFAANLDFIKNIIENYDEKYENAKICIDVANGNMPKLHQLIRRCKETYKNITLMAGNVSSLKAFLQLESTGIDAIRVGIGGGNNCTTTVNTGVGQPDLFKLVNDCYLASETDVEIIADGVSAFTRMLPHDDYAQYRTIILLLYAGADSVMLGTAFARMHDSIGDRFYKNTDNLSELVDFGDYVLLEERVDNDMHIKPQLYKQTFGMSTKQMQYLYSNGEAKTSEGISKMISIDYTLDEWLNGAKYEKHDKVGGFVNYLRSAMSYTGCIDLDSFIGSWKQ